MKTIGILGGMSSASTLLYYRRLCERTREMRGGLHSPQLLIRAVDFAPIAAMQAAGEWKEAGRELNLEARALVRGGAQLLILATNTMHKIADHITASVPIPFLHIADATAEAIVTHGFSRPGLIATAHTMEEDFYTDRLRAHHLSPLIPDQAERAEIHRVIYEELCRDIVADKSRAFYERVAAQLAARGADCLILGCTEVGMLLSDANAALPVFDTTLIHCDAALDFALR